MSDAPKKTSRLTGFYRLPLAARRAALVQAGWLTPQGADAIAAHAGFDETVADQMSENVVGVHALPLSVGLHFVVNGREHVAPMSVEEPSVVAAASHAARLALTGGGFVAESDPPLMVAQVQLLDVPEADAAVQALVSRKQALVDQANVLVDEMVKRGGGVRDLDVRVLARTPAGAMLVVHLVVDTPDAMSANLLNTLVF